MKELVSFLILHYNTIFDTIGCIESIKKNMLYDNYIIVVVDNGSTNQSGMALEEKYYGKKKIIILKSDKNLGFAKGNNYGFNYIKKNTNSKFIIMLNNDTIITQKNFITVIEKIYNEEKFAILGPKIISLVDRSNQNPVKVQFDDRKEVFKAMFKYLFLYLFNLVGIEDFIRFLKDKINKTNLEKPIKEANKRYQLHGSCLIFSQDYLQKHDGLYDKTFLYAEEDILSFICKRDNLTQKYDERIFIYHKEDSATNYTFKTTKKKRRFIYKHTAYSLYQLYQLMKKKE